jgi:hypothetical protein
MLWAFRLDSSIHGYRQESDAVYVHAALDMEIS